MANLSMKQISKTYPNGVTAVQSVDLDVYDNEFLVLVGPSGCGKSTTLRMIAGLEEITGGELLIDGKKVNDVPSKDRDIAMVFQNYALYPHMTIYNNMAFGLKMRKIPKDEIKQRVEAVAKILGIEDLLERKPKTLSGGQRQRAAMGRAIVREPKVFLMDEPLSNLDAKLRTQMRTEIYNLYKRLKTTFVYVTHDHAEAMTLGTRIVVMDKGIVQQIDTPKNLYNKPINMFVAGFIGTPQMNFIDASSHAGKALSAITGQCSENVMYGVRPEHFSVGEGNMTAIVERVELMGADMHIHLDLNGINILSSCDPDTLANNGDVVKINVDKRHIHVFDKTTGETVMA